VGSSARKALGARPARAAAIREVFAEDEGEGVDSGGTDTTAPEPDAELSLEEQCETVCAGLDVCTDAGLSDGCMDICVADALEVAVSCVTPPMACDTVGECLGLEPARPEVTWTAHIQPICLQRCGGCHTANAVAGVQVNTYADVIKPSPNCYPGKTVAQAIALKVTETPGCGGQMPPGHAPKLSLEDQQLFADWVKAGWPE
jgi:hypothetical protein